MTSPNYHAKEITIFAAGFLAGGLSLCVFLLVKRMGYETEAWFVSGSTAAGIAALFFYSRLLQRLAEINAAEQVTLQEMAREDTAQPPQLKTTNAEQPANENIRSELMFPHSTKALAAARAASIKFWSKYDPERPPLQKQVTAFMIEQGIPARQAAELAIAIKPDAFQTHDGGT